MEAHHLTLDVQTTLRRSNHRLVAMTRRGLDITLAIVVLLLLVPLVALVAMAIRLDSKGPILFRQRRLGKGMEPFTVLKFRTMTTGADATPHREYVKSLIGRAENQCSREGTLYKLAVDNRVTRIGRHLRRWSVDEIPQLLNVVRGDMALVGPRPVIPYEAELYPDTYMRRFDVKPGLTGLWQVSGRNERTYDEMVRLDVEYADRNHLWGDLMILCKTIKVVVRGRGAA
jgi:lipopolysaccharide/colanic/teichoic acid biosynthesis glycosyltransferase